MTNVIICKQLTLLREGMHVCEYFVWVLGNSSIDHASTFTCIPRTCRHTQGNTCHEDILFLLLFLQTKTALELQLHAKQHHQ